MVYFFIFLTTFVHLFVICYSFDHFQMYFLFLISNVWKLKKPAGSTDRAKMLFYMKQSTPCIIRYLFQIHLSLYWKILFIFACMFYVQPILCKSIFISRTPFFWEEIMSHKIGVNAGHISYFNVFSAICIAPSWCGIISHIKSTSTLFVSRA